MKDKEKRVYNRYLLLSYLGILVLTIYLIFSFSDNQNILKIVNIFELIVGFGGVGLICFAFVLLKIRKVKKRRLKCHKK